MKRKRLRGRALTGVPKTTGDFRAEGGFTAIEFLLTAAVAILLISLAAPSVVQGLDKTRLRATAELMASEIERAKTMAMTQGTAFEIQIDPVNGTLAIIDVAEPGQAMREPKRLPPDIHFRSTPEDPIRMLPRGPVRGGTLQLANGDGLTVSVSVTSTGRTQVGVVQTADNPEVAAP